MHDVKTLAFRCLDYYSAFRDIGEIAIFTYRVISRWGYPISSGSEDRVLIGNLRVSWWTVLIQVHTPKTLTIIYIQCYCRQLDVIISTPSRFITLNRCQCRRQSCDLCSKVLYQHSRQTTLTVCPFPLHPFDLRHSMLRVGESAAFGVGVKSSWTAYFDNFSKLIGNGTPPWRWRRALVTISF